jgi:hypothetical protein
MTCLVSIVLGIDLIMHDNYILPQEWYEQPSHHSDWLHVNTFKCVIVKYYSKFIFMGGVG